MRGSARVHERLPRLLDTASRLRRGPTHGGRRRPPTAAERGFVTSGDLLEAVPVDDFTQEQVEEFLTAVQEHLTAEGVEVIEVPGDDTDAATQVRIEVDLLRAPTIRAAATSGAAEKRKAAVRRSTPYRAATARSVSRFSIYRRGMSQESLP